MGRKNVPNSRSTTVERILKSHRFRSYYIESDTKRWVCSPSESRRYIDGDIGVIRHILKDINKIQVLMPITYGYQIKVKKAIFVTDFTSEREGQDELSRRALNPFD